MMPETYLRNQRPDETDDDYLFYVAAILKDIADHMKDKNVITADQHSRLTVIARRIRVEAINIKE